MWVERGRYDAVLTMKAGRAKQSPRTTAYGMLASYEKSSNVFSPPRRSKLIDASLHENSTSRTGNTSVSLKQRTNTRIVSQVRRGAGQTDYTKKLGSDVIVIEITNHVV